MPSGLWKEQLGRGLSAGINQGIEMALLEKRRKAEQEAEDARKLNEMILKAKMEGFQEGDESVIKTLPKGATIVNFGKGYPTLYKEPSEMDTAKLKTEQAKAEWYGGGRQAEAERNRQLKRDLAKIGKSQGFKESDYLNIVKQAKNNAVKQMETMYGQYASYMFEPDELKGMMEEIENAELEKLLENIKKVKMGGGIITKDKEPIPETAMPKPAVEIPPIEVQTQGNEMIRVKFKSTGQTGKIPKNEFDPNLYEIIK